MAAGAHPADPEQDRNLVAADLTTNHGDAVILCPRPLSALPSWVIMTLCFDSQYVHEEGGPMKRTLQVLPLFVAVAALAAAPALAQTPAASHAAIEKQIVANERAINDAFAKGDVKAFHAGNVAPDAIGIDPTGINKINTPEMDKMITSTKISTWNIDGSQFQWIGDTTVVHLYRWTGKGTANGQAIPGATWSSTVWTNRGGKWLAVFHQETDAMAPPPAAAKPAAMPAPVKK
jgi:hypothetical protein